MAISSTDEEPLPLSFMPGPSGTESDHATKVGATYFSGCDNNDSFPERKSGESTDQDELQP